jgi:hypothetical protein
MKRNFARRSLKTLEWIWLVIAILSLEKVFSQWNNDRQKAYIFTIFTFLGVFMFLFRRIQRKKMESSSESKKDSPGKAQ